MSGWVCVCVCVHVDTCAFVLFGRQVPMVGKGVVEALMATLAAVQGGGAPALPVQQAACMTLQYLTAAAANRVRMCVWDRPGIRVVVARVSTFCGVCVDMIARDMW